MRFTKDHEWVSLEDGVATIGVTAFAADQLGDVVFVETPEIGRTVKKGDPLAVVESVKAASDVFSPLSGDVVAANETLGSAPETVNAEPESGGWFARIKASDPGEIDALMDRAAYEDFLATL